MMRSLLLLDTLCALSLSKSCHISNFDAAAEESASTAAVLAILAIGIKQLIIVRST
jgi:hypothetical protein